MRAAVLHGRADLRVEEVPVPVPGPGEVLLEVGTVGLCGTDASEFANGPKMFPVHARNPVTGHLGPMVIGHEFGGRVVELGEGVDDSWLGRAVASCGAVSCGVCWHCARGRTNLCTSYAGVGLHRSGALAEFVATPADSITAVDVLGLTPDAAALGQPMSIAVHARGRGRVAAGERVVILGVGGIGAFLVYAIRATGCEIVAVDASTERLDLARRLGAQEALLAQTTGEKEVLEALGGPPHVVFEASGRSDALALAWGLLPAGGRLVPVGLQGAHRELDLRRLTLTELEIIGTNAMVRGADFDTALSLVASRAEGWGDVAPRVMRLEDVAERGLAAIAAGQAGAVKLLVDPRTTSDRDAMTRPTTGRAD